MQQMAKELRSKNWIQFFEWMHLDYFEPEEFPLSVSLSLSEKAIRQERSWKQTGEKKKKETW
jgi:hypothetical protein